MQNSLLYNSDDIEVRNSGLKTRSLARVIEQAILTSLRLPLVYVIRVKIPENATLVFRSIVSS